MKKIRNGVLTVYLMENKIVMPVQLNLSGNEMRIEFSIQYKTRGWERKEEDYLEHMLNLEIKPDNRNSNKQ